jgi:hypothetical protein
MRSAAFSITPRTKQRRRAGAFHLRKWYLDVTADDGRAAILYHARLRWGPLRFSYAGFLTASVPPVTASGGRCSSPSVVHRASIRAADPPRESPDSLSWSCPRLGASGTWHPAAPPAHRTLLERDDGAVLWSCLMPRARASVSLDGLAPINGWGYAERLDLTLRPWRLPIDTLRWGRFTSDAAGLVWIQWLGPEPRLLLLLDGREIDAASARITDDSISWPAARLDLAAGLTLRRGTLNATVLRDTPLLRALAPRAARALDEHKTLSRATLHLPGRPPARGWAIHETVLFREPAP